MKTKNKDKNKSFRRIYDNNFFLFKIAFKEAPLYVIYKLIWRGIHSVSVFIEHVFLVGFIINSIIMQRPFKDVATVISAVIIFLFLYGIFGALFEYYFEPKIREKINRRINLELYKKASEIDLACYDNPEFYNDLVWAMSEATNRTHGVIGTLGELFGGIIGIATIAGFMLSQDRVGVIIVAVSAVCIFFVSNKKNKLSIAMHEKTRPTERKSSYMNRILYLPEYAKELRLNNIKPKLYEQYEEAIAKTRKIAKRESKKLAVYDFLSGFVFNTMLIDGAYLFFLLYRTIVLNAFQYGTLVVLYNSCNRLRNTFFNLSYVLPQFQENSLYIEKIRRFLDYESTLKSPENAIPVPEGNQTLELRNVSFGYNDDSLVLKNISMTINKGEKIALVGYNGAGKTTLVKLFMRLYDPVGGEILYGGNNVKEYNLSEYRDAFQTVFQDYQIFAASVGENIVMDVTPIDEKQAADAIEKGGFAEKFSEYKTGWDTQVSREFDPDGALFSGGELQRLAISRALYHNSPLLILDEPSSALDPAGEYNLNKTMLEMGIDSGKSVVIISHRLSTTMIADKIYMLEDGEIAEVGTHNELMAKNGKYAYMFNLQAEKYRAEVL